MKENAFPPKLKYAARTRPSFLGSRKRSLLLAKWAFAQAPSRADLGQLPPAGLCTSKLKVWLQAPRRETAETL